MRALERWQCLSKNSHYDLDLGPRTLKLKLVQDIVILNIHVKQNQNWSINKGARAMMMCFSKNSHCALDLGSRTLNLEPIQDIVILNICVK